jgi:LemA protein
MKVWIALLAALAAALAVGIGGVRARNELVALDTAAQAQWGQIDNQLQRRHELLPQLAAVARRYAEHEKGILETIAASRAAYAGAAPAARPRIAGQLDGTLVHLLALAESYPELKADSQFRDLSYEIAGTQNRVALERQRYNETVAALNARLRQIPWSFLAFGIEARAFYEPPAEKLTEPELSL